MKATLKFGKMMGYTKALVEFNEKDDVKMKVVHQVIMETMRHKILFYLFIYFCIKYHCIFIFLLRG